MNRFGIAVLAAVFVILSGQAPQAPAPKHLLHLVYQFGYNTKVASAGQGTGTTTVDVSGPAADGGYIVSAADFWWNTVRSRATNTCEVYASGKVSCNTAPNALSPIQLTIFPLLAHNYFKGLSASGTSTWTNSYTVKAAVIPGAAGFAGQAYTWNCTYHMQGKGPVPNGSPLILITTNGTLSQGYFNATSKQRILYDPVNKVPAFASDVRTHIPQRSVYSNDLVEVKLTKMQRG